MEEHEEWRRKIHASFKREHKVLIKRLQTCRAMRESGDPPDGLDRLEELAWNRQFLVTLGLMMTSGPRGARRGT